MKYYAQFKVLHNKAWSKEQGKLVDVIPYLRDKIGSDGVYVLDGRNNLCTMIVDCHDRVAKLRNLFQVDGFDICKGEKFSTSVIVYQSLQLN